MEKWKEIEGYEGIYEVSNIGNIKSVERIDNNNHRRNERILKQFLDKDGYCIVNLYKGGNMKSKKVHRLVAEAFIENPNNYPQINHKDEKKTNNNVDNLEWCDVTYNTTYGTCKERMANTKRGHFHHTEESKRKISESRKRMFNNINNSLDYAC